MAWPAAAVEGSELPGTAFTPPQTRLALLATADAAKLPAANAQKIVLPSGTRLPLRLSNRINTGTAKTGDSVYFETIYPLAQDGRIVVPMGSFVQGHLVEVRRPGRIKGRGEIAVHLDSLTLPNGYVVALNATPNSADTGGKETVNSEGKVEGPSGVGHDVGTVLAITTGGAYLGTNIALLTSSSLGRGAAIGGAAGAATGLALILLTRGPEAELPRGTILDVVFSRPLAFDADRLALSDPGKLASLPEARLRPQGGRPQDRTARQPQAGSLRRLLPF